MKGELADVGRELREEQRRHRDTLDAERAQRADALRDLRARVESLALGGLHVEWAGVWYLVLGVILATISAEIVSWLG